MSTPASPSTVSQSETPASAVRCARSPRIVSDPLRARRTVIRSSIGVRFCASSTTTCPKRRKDGSISHTASSSSATSVGVISRRFTAADDASSNAISSSDSRSPATRANRALFLNSLSTSPSGVSRGHARVASRWYSLVLRTTLSASSSDAIDDGSNTRDAIIPASRSRNAPRPAS